MKKIVINYDSYGLMVTMDGSAYYIETETGEVLHEFPKSLPEEINGVIYYPTNEEIWIVVGNLMGQMDRALNNF